MKHYESKNTSMKKSGNTAQASNGFRAMAITLVCVGLSASFPSAAHANQSPKSLPAEFFSIVPSPSNTESQNETAPNYGMSLLSGAGGLLAGGLVGLGLGTGACALAFGGNENCLILGLIGGIIGAPAGGLLSASWGLKQTHLKNLNKRKKTFAMKLSGFQLSMGPMYDLTGEYRVSDRFSVAMIAGYGKLKTNTVNLSDETVGESVVDATNIGLQLAFYAGGDFDDGVQVGCEIAYLKLDRQPWDQAWGTGIGTGLREGMSYGPFLGYKISYDLGLTLEVQLTMLQVTPMRDTPVYHEDDVLHAQRLCCEGMSLEELLNAPRKSALSTGLNAKMGWAF